MPTLEELFHSYNGIVKDGHWFAVNYKANHDGYIRVKFQDKYIYLHRLILATKLDLDYEDKSWQANHKPECETRRCWNPEHLYKGTHQDNMSDRSSKARQASHCPNGHEYNETNKWHYKGCRLCLKEANERAKQRRRDLHANNG